MSIFEFYEYCWIATQLNGKNKPFDAPDASEIGFGNELKH